MKMAMQKLLRKIPFTSKPRIEEMLANDDFTKYTQDDLDYFEEILVQCSEDKCKDMIRSYFKVLSGLAKKSSGDGFFRRVVSMFRKMLQSASGTDKKHEENVAAPSKKRRRRSSAGIYKRIKRQDALNSAVEIAEDSVICVDNGNASVRHTIRDSSANYSEHTHSEHLHGIRSQRRKMSYGYCPEDLVGKPISPDMFTRALNPEYNFLPGLPKLVLGDIPTDEEDEYFRNREYLNSFSDDCGERCNFNDGKPYSCKKCVEKEYVDKMESIGLLGCDAGLLGVVADRRHVPTEDEEKDNMHSMQEKRRKIEGKYYVDWATKTDTPSAARFSVGEDSLVVPETYTGSKNAIGDALSKAGAVEAKRHPASHVAEKIDRDDKDTVCDVITLAENAQCGSKNGDEKEKAHIYGLAEDTASKATTLIPVDSGGHKNHEFNVSSLTGIPSVAYVEAPPSCNISAEATPGPTSSKKQIEQAGHHPLLSTEVPKPYVGIPHMIKPESLSSVQNTVLSAEGNATPSYICGAAEKDTDLSVDELQKCVGMPQVLQQTTETQSIERPPSIAVPYCWNSAIAAHKKSTGEHSPAKKRDLQTMQNRSSAVPDPAFALQKDHQSQIPLNYTQGSAMEKTSLLSNTGAIENAFGSGMTMDAKPESTYSAYVPERPHGGVETGRQDAPNFANLFATNALEAANSQPLILPPGNLFGNPNDETSRPSREGQGVASRFNRRKR